MTNKLFIIGQDGSVKATSNNPSAAYGRLGDSYPDLEIEVTPDRGQEKGRRDPDQVAETTQFYSKYGFFPRLRLTISDDMPEELMAKAIAAAYRVIAEEVDKRLA